MNPLLIIRKILEANRDSMKKKDINGNRPIDLAKSSNHVEAVQLLQVALEEEEIMEKEGKRKRKPKYHRVHFELDGEIKPNDEFADVERCLGAHWRRLGPENCLRKGRLLLKEQDDKLKDLQREIETIEAHLTAVKLSFQNP